MALSPALEEYATANRVYHSFSAFAFMTITLSDSVKYLRGVGPQRAAILEEHGIATVSDLLSYLPFRYEDRIRFTRIAELIPGQVHTILRGGVPAEAAAPCASCAGAAPCFT